MLTTTAQAPAAAAADTPLLPGGATNLRQLMQRLKDALRLRSFKTVPMILQSPDQWDHEALSEVIAYRGGLRQVWNNTELGGPWLNLMRNSLNAQIWSFKHPDFLIVSATHGSAHLALFDQTMWDKYGLAKLAGEKFSSNTLISEKPAGASGASDYQNPQGAFSSHDNSIAALQRRGAVFLSCHNATWELADLLNASGSNPDRLPVDALAAELTNHVIPGAIVTPGAVGTLPELQQAGFHYAA